jgi:hypothetical protein
MATSQRLDALERLIAADQGLSSLNLTNDITRMRRKRQSMFGCAACAGECERHAQLGRRPAERLAGATETIGSDCPEANRSKKWRYDLRGDIALREA